MSESTLDFLEREVSLIPPGAALCFSIDHMREAMRAFRPALPFELAWKQYKEDRGLVESRGDRFTTLGKPKEELSSELQEWIDKVAKAAGVK